ncbi:hypothetical protein [Pelomonas sp. Root1444]|uniref:hypothetical protein n=1 Tax=Pelomonas sp. Root1444 TaxID=1736464 RepID=UPI0012FADC12|nr:hypothetical protein [Pelomonas sp. Root1444]
MRVAYSLLASFLFAASALLGLFVVATAALGVGSERAISEGFIVWAIGSLVAAVGLLAAVRRPSLALALGLCAVPFGLALFAAHFVMRFGQ